MRYRVSGSSGQGCIRTPNGHRVATYDARTFVTLDLALKWVDTRVSVGAEPSTFAVAAVQDDEAASDAAPL